MTKSWFRLSRYPAAAVFFIAAVFAALFSWNSLNLATVAMANIRFINMFGTLAVMEGGLGQLLEIGAKGLASLVFYLGFKACEVELVYRWRAWSA